MWYISSHVVKFTLNFYCWWLPKGQRSALFAEFLLILKSVGYKEALTRARTPYWLIYLEITCFKGLLNWLMVLILTYNYLSCCFFYFGTASEYQVHRFCFLVLFSHTCSLSQCKPLAANIFKDWHLNDHIYLGTENQRWHRCRKSA